MWYFNGVNFYRLLPHANYFVLFCITLASTFIGYSLLPIIFLLILFRIGIYFYRLLRSCRSVCIFYFFVFHRTHFLKASPPPSPYFGSLPQQLVRSGDNNAMRTVNNKVRGFFATTHPSNSEGHQLLGCGNKPH